jgi:hypothetical protein
VSSLDPTSGAPEGGTIVVITGENFVDVTAVRFGSAPAASFSVDGDTQIRAEAGPVDFSGIVDVVVSTAVGDSTTSGASAFTYAGTETAAPAAQCSVSAFNVPVGRSGCTQVGTKAGEQFRMEADFRGPNCACCEYRQFVRGTFVVNGRAVRHLLPDPAGGAPRPMLPRPAPGSGNDNFLEDGFAAPPAGINSFYGHRSQGDTDPSDRYLPDRATGCQYRGTDFPGIRAASGATFTVDLDFRGRVIDTCNGNVVKNFNEWTVRCSGTI